MDDSKIDEKDNGVPHNANDHLANERTFLAWIRTSIALMGFGFVIVRFSLFLTQFSLVVKNHEQNSASKEFSSSFGLVFVVVGALTAIIGYIRYMNVRNQLLQNRFKPANVTLLLLTISIILTSLLLLWYLLPEN
jgi:putative membrane protein